MWSPASLKGNFRTKLSLQNLFSILDSGDETSVFKINSIVPPKLSPLVIFLPSGGGKGGGVSQFFLLQTGRKLTVFGPKLRCV